MCREEEGIELMKEMKARFSAIVSSASKNLILDSMPSTELVSLIEQIGCSRSLFIVLCAKF